jgi:hypothetical protein
MHDPPCFPVFPALPYRGSFTRTSLLLYILPFLLSNYPSRLRPGKSPYTYRPITVFLRMRPRSLQAILRVVKRYTIATKTWKTSAHKHLGMRQEQPIQYSESPLRTRKVAGNHEYPCTDKNQSYHHRRGAASSSKSAGAQLGCIQGGLDHQNREGSLRDEDPLVFSTGHWLAPIARTPSAKFRLHGGLHARSCPAAHASASRQRISDIPGVRPRSIRCPTDAWASAPLHEPPSIGQPRRFFRGIGVFVFNGVELDGLSRTNQPFCARTGPLEANRSYQATWRSAWRNVIRGRGWNWLNAIPQHQHQHV